MSEQHQHAIPGVKLTDLITRQDDRGFLYEVVKAHEIAQFGQSYIVGDWAQGTVRAYHRHKATWDYFHIVSGAALFVLVWQPDPELVGTDAADVAQVICPEPIVQTMVLSGRHPQRLDVPPGVWHGWQALAEDTKLQSTASTVYDRACPDEERIPADAFGDVWGVKPR